MKKRVLSILLAVTMVFSVLPTNVMASDSGNLEFSLTQDDTIGADGKSIEYENGYKLSVTYDAIGENRISEENGHTELRNIPNGTTVTFALEIPEGQSNVPTLLLADARETFVGNVVTRSLDFSVNSVIFVSLDFGGNPGPGPSPEIDNGDIRFEIQKDETDLSQYSLDDGTTWIPVENNTVVKAENLTGVASICVKAVPGEGRQLDDYVEPDAISVNRVRIGDNASALEFNESGVAYILYDSNAQTVVVVRFMNAGSGGPNPGGQDDGHIVKLQINNNDGADGCVQCKFDTEAAFTSYTVANKDASGNIRISIPEGAGKVTFKAVPGEGYVIQDCTILYDDQDIDETKAYRSGVEGDGYEYTIPDDDKTLVFRADFGNALVSWHTVSWGGPNVHIENGYVEAYAVQVGENTYDESVEAADETNKCYPLSYITNKDIQTNPVSFGNTDMFIADTNTEAVFIDFRFIPDYGYQVTDVIATEGSVLDQFNPGEEISTFHFEYKPNTNVHFIVEFTSSADIINTEGSIVSSATIGDGANAISSGNLKMDIEDVAPTVVSEGLKNEVGGNDAQYLDMKLSQVVSKTGSNGNWESQLSELGGAIDVSLTVSNLDPDGEYYIIREHTNGDGSTSYDEIPVNYDSATSKISFETNKFSTYALVKKSASAPHTHGTGGDAITFTAWDGGEGHNSMPDEEGNFYLTSDITLTETWKPKGTTNLCLNGHVINANGGSFRVVTIDNNAILNLYDCKTTEHKGYTDSDGLWHLGEKASLGAGEVSKSINGGIITGGIGTESGDIKGGGVFVNSGTFNMFGGTIAGNKVNAYGGGVRVYSGNLTISGNGRITGNVATLGGGVHFAGTTFNLSGGSIDNNIANNGGGVALGSASGTTNMTGGSIDHNKANSNVGGVQVTSGNFYMSGGSIDHNTAAAYGSLYVNGTVVLGGTAKITENVTGGTITGGVLSGGTTYNVFVPNGKTFTLGNGSNGVPAPSEEMLVGVTTVTAPTDSNPVAITSNGSSTDTGYFISDDTGYVVKFDTDKLVLACAPYIPESYTVTFEMNGHGTQVTPQTIAKNSTASQPANPSASGWSFGGWYSNTGLTVAYNFSTPITADTTLYAKWTQNTPTPDPDPYYPPYIPDITPEPTKDPEPIAEPVEDYIVPVESDKDAVQVSATIEGGIATVDEITGDVLEDIIEKKTSDEESDTTREATDSVTIDLSEAKQDVTGAELSKKSVETLSDVVSDEANNLDSVVIKMKEASVELDAKTLETLHESMAGDTVKLVVDKISEKGLNENQKSTLSNCNVARTFEAYFESNGEKIHDFKGGTVKVSVSFKPEKGKNANNYKAYFLDEKGVLQKHVTKYENGRLTFLTGHFSNYVIIYDNVKDVLLAQAATTKKGYIKLSWNEIDGAVKYVVYGAKCGNSYNELAELDAETDGNVFTIKKINGAKPVAGKTYKLYVVAYDALGNKIKSKSIHYIAGDTSAKYANVETITPLAKTLEMTVGEKVTVGAEYTMYEDKKHTSKKHGKALRFTSNCAEVAKVSSDGTVTAKSEGKATIYIQDISGKWCKVEVTVKEK